MVEFVIVQESKMVYSWPKLQAQIVLKIIKIFCGAI